MRIQPGNLLIHTEEGQSLRELLLREGILLDFPCGGKGRCGQCRIRITPPPESGKGRQDLLSPEELEQGTRLACETVLEQDCRIFIPEGKRADKAWRDASKLEETRLGLGDAFISKRFFTIPEPSLEDQRSDWERVHKALTEKGYPVVQPDFSCLQDLPGNLRRNGGNIHLLVEGDTPLCSCCCEEGNCRYFGFAVDLGTTTVDVALYNLESGRCIGRKTLLNRQASFGADVISRAQAFRDDRKKVRQAALDTIQEAALLLLREAGLEAKSVIRSVVVGNPIMIHILQDLDPVQLTHSPYIPVISDMIRRKPQEYGWDFQKYGYVESLPLISAFVGADTVGMILALGLGRTDGRKTTLSVDIGTNGELVLAREGRLYSTSAAAGPAFEGAQIACGTRAVPGAICQVEISGDRVSYETLGGESPIGICGTALIMAIAQLLSIGVIDGTGRLLEPKEVREPSLRGRLFRTNGGAAFSLTEDRKVYITQKDIRELQLAKGAIRTAIEVLLDQVGVPWEEVDKVSLAGNFGAGMDIEAETRIGLLPQIDSAKVDVVGNAALRGASLALMSRTHRDMAIKIPSSCTFLELAGRPDFQERFADSLLF